MNKITAEQMRKILSPIPTVHIYSEDYAAVDWGWLLNDGYKAFRNWIFEQFGVMTWKKRFQCEMFGIYFYLFARSCHFTHNSGDGDFPEAPAIGWVEGDYWGGNHIYNIVLTTVNNTLIVLFFEPQTGRQLEIPVDKIKLIRAILI